MAERAAWTETVADDSRPLWLERVRDELDALVRPRSVALVGGEAVDRVASSAVLAELGRVVGIAPVSVTEVGLAGVPARTSQELLGRLEGHPLLFDLEALCWDPWLAVDLRRFLEIHARRSGVVALWPGRVSGRVAVFSAPGRKDHQRVELGGWSVLRPVATRFPDEVPFEIERVAQ